MNKNTFLIIFLFFVNAISFAQQGKVGHLTIFSEDGDKFFVILNGEPQNNIPQTNIRIEDLNQPYYNVTIRFESQYYENITKNSLMIADADGVMSDVTYKIKRDKNNTGKMKLNYYSSIPVEQGFKASPNVYVMHYGQPNPPSNQSSFQGNQSGNVTQTTTTTTTTTNGGENVNANFNFGGVNMGVSIHDEMANGTSVGSTTTTTTTTTTSSSNFDSDGRIDQSSGTSSTGACPSRYAMTPKDFNAALETLKKQSFEDTRLKTAKQIVSVNCMNVDQLIQIANTFNFEDNKLDFAKFAYDYCVEPKNYFKFNGIFKFSMNADDLSDYIQSRN